jgi:hypothetical protein
MLAAATMLQSCTPFPDIIQSATTEPELRERVLERFPLGSEAVELRAEIERQGSGIVSAPSPTGIRYAALVQGRGFPCKPVVRILWREGPTGRITKLDAELVSVCT